MPNHTRSVAFLPSPATRPRNSSSPTVSPLRCHAPQQPQHHQHQHQQQHPSNPPRRPRNPIPPAPTPARKPSKPPNRTSQILAAARSPNLNNLRQVVKYALAEGYVLNTVNYTTIANAYAVHAHPSQCFRILHNMQREQVPPNFVTLRTAIKAAERWASTPHLLRSADKQKPAEALLHVLHWLASHSKPHQLRHPDAIRSWNQALRAFARMSALPTLQLVFDMMSLHTAGVPPPNTWSYNTYLSTFKKSSRLLPASLVWANMLRSRVKPDVVTYNLLLDIAIFGDLSPFQPLHKQNQYDCAPALFVNAIFNSMQRHAVLPNTLTETLVMRVLSSSTHSPMHSTLIWQRFLTTIRNDHHQNVLDKAYFDSALTAFGKAADIDGMHLAFKTMHQRNINLDQNTINALLLGARAFQDAAMACKILEVCHAGNLHLDHKTYTTAISVCSVASGSSNPQLAEQILYDALESGIHWNDSMLNAAIASHGAFSSHALSMWQRLRKCSDEHSRKALETRVVYDALMRVCGRDARADTALRVLYAAKKAGHVRPNSAQSRVLYSAFRRGVREGGREADINGLWMGAFARHLRTECGFNEHEDMWDLPVEKIRIRF